MPGDFGGEGYCDECDACNCGRHHHHGGLCQRWNQDAGFNCGCNGSCNLPLSRRFIPITGRTYSQVLMTDYHSPWRFPAIKPYVDEVPPEALGASKTLRVQQAAALLLRLVLRAAHRSATTSSDRCANMRLGRRIKTPL